MSGWIGLFVSFGVVLGPLAYLWWLWTRASPAELPADLTARARFRSDAKLKEVASWLEEATRKIIIDRHRRSGRWGPVGPAIRCSPPGPTRLRVDAKSPQGGDLGPYLLVVLSRSGRCIEALIRASGPRWLPGVRAPRALSEATVELVSTALTDRRFRDVEWHLRGDWRPDSSPSAMRAPGGGVT